VSILMVAILIAAVVLPFLPRDVHGEIGPDHLVISEVVAGGVSASDELIELYNPTAAPLPLEGLELVYASASGATVSRRAAWELGAPSIPPGHHLLVANELGIYAPIADAIYASGMAASGGSVALRIQGAATAVDAVGWGTAASTWLEGAPVAAPAAGSSLERRPGGPAGSTQDTDDNAADFVERPVPDPQNAASPPVPDPAGTSPSPTPSAVPTHSSSTPGPSGSATASPSGTPGPAVVSIATARSLPEGTALTIEGTALTDSGFTEGGGYVADESGGIAVLLSAGSFERGSRLRISGTVDERFSQRTLRNSEAEIVTLGPGTEPSPATVATGSVGEPVEGRLVRVAGTIAGAPTELSASLAFAVDDGSGPIRVLVGTDTGIDTAGWRSGTTLEVVGVVGQRDSSGTGIAGYRVQPRDVGDVYRVGGPSTTPTPSASTGGPDPSASASAPATDVVPIADARRLPRNARVTVRGTVTMPPGLVDPVSAVIQDDSGAILLRVGEEVGPLARGARIQVAGTRSTLGGMETLRVTAAAVRLGTASEPQPSTARTGDAGEALEARLTRVRGALVAAARRASSGSVSFEIDDGSGPLRVFLAASLDATTENLAAGTWVEATGVLGQETSGAQPLRGYRLWPRAADEVRVTAATPSGSSDAGVSGGDAGNGGTATDGTPTAGLDRLDAQDLASLRVGATLVHGPWPELDLGGLLWDGTRLVGIDETSGPAVEGLVTRAGSTPVAVELGGLTAAGRETVTDIPMVELSDGPGDLAVREAPADAPSVDMPHSGARWVSVVGRLVLDAGAPRLRIDEGGDTVALERHCDEEAEPPAGTVQVTGIGLADPSRIVVPCGGVRAAPALVMAALARAEADAGAAPETPAATGLIPPERGAGTRVAAAALLAIGAILISIAVAIGRRLEPDPAGDLGVPAAQESDAAASGAGDPESTPRALTLVALPREHESP
jgi:hypothetical protein